MWHWLKCNMKREKERKMYGCCESRVKKNEIVVQIVKRFCITREEPGRNKDRNMASQTHSTVKENTLPFVSVRNQGRWSVDWKHSTMREKRIEINTWTTSFPESLFFPSPENEVDTTFPTIWCQFVLSSQGIPLINDTATLQSLQQTMIVAYRMNINYLNTTSLWRSDVTSLTMRVSLLTSQFKFCFIQ